MPLTVRLGDVNQVGGRAMTGAPSVIVNGKVVATHGCVISGHGDHPPSMTVTGSSTVFAEGKPVVYVGVSETCGHSRVTGSPNVIVGQ